MQEWFAWTSNENTTLGCQRTENVQWLYLLYLCTATTFVLPVPTTCVLLIEIGVIWLLHLAKGVYEVFVSEMLLCGKFISHY